MAGQISSILVGLVAVPLYSYVFGIVPAWLTGVAAAAISPLVKRNSVWVGITAAIGWIFVSIALAAMQLLMDDPGQQLLNGYVGAVPALLCALMTQSRRPRQGNPIPARS